jgi:large subunit ribosomal protein L16
MMPYVPKKAKFKKLQKGKKLNTMNKVFSLNKFSFGKLGLRAVNTGHMNSKQVSCLKQTLNKIVKKRGKVKINIFPSIQVTKKPLEVRMGKGKGNVDR